MSRHKALLPGGFAFGAMETTREPDSDDFRGRLGGRLYWVSLRLAVSIVFFFTFCPVGLVLNSFPYFCLCTPPPPAHTLLILRIPPTNSAMRAQTTFLVLSGLLSTLVQAHLVPWHPGMYCFGVRARMILLGYLGVRSDI